MGVFKNVQGLIAKAFRNNSDYDLKEALGMILMDRAKYKALHAARGTPPKLRFGNRNYGLGRLSWKRVLNTPVPTERAEHYLHSYARRHGEYHSDMQKV